MGSKAFESPLISHARMRAMYRALVETRVLSEHAPRPQRFAKRLEACWVAAAIDLKPGDLTSEEGGSALVQHVLRVGAREAAKAATANDVKKTLRELEEEKSVCRFAGTAFERLLCATGQAMALQAADGKHVVVAFVAQDELKPAEWRRIFTVAAPELPLIVVVLPGKGSDLEKAARKADGRPAVPVIPVDAGDVVALYRVAQESIGRARGEGGVAVIDCVAIGTDPVKLMGSQLVKKGICTEAWVAGVDASFRRLVGGV
jgi:TPP-dependent pyruvate/acetoin dehydrogenase alpha subunit